MMISRLSTKNFARSSQTPHNALVRSVRAARAASSSSKSTIHQVPSPSGSTTNKSSIAKKQPLHSSAHQENASIASAVSADMLGGLPNKIPPSVPTPTREQLRALFISALVPMVGFGAMDNFVMIQAGGYIDSTIGVTFGLATLTAAAMGQMVSDASGVIFGGTIERLVNRLGIAEAPNLTAAQRLLPVSRNVILAGSVVGVTMGCLLGAISLWFVSDGEQQKRAADVQETIASMLERDESGNGLAYEGCTVYLMSSTNLITEQATNGLASSTRFRLLSEDADKNSVAAQSAHSGTSVVINHDARTSTLYAPICHQGRSFGVVEFRNKLVNNEDESRSFSKEDERIAMVTARHLAIFMEQMLKSGA